MDGLDLRLVPPRRRFLPRKDGTVYRGAVRERYPKVTATIHRRAATQQQGRRVR
jgi:hypothetical protein